MKYLSSSTLCWKVISKLNIFKKQAKLQGQGHRVKLVGLVTRNTHLKYQSFCNHCSKVITNVRVLKKYVNITCWHIHKTYANMVYIFFISTWRSLAMIQCTKLIFNKNDKCCCKCMVKMEFKRKFCSHFPPLMSVLKFNSACEHQEQNDMLWVTLHVPVPLSKMHSVRNRSWFGVFKENISLCTLAKLPVQVAIPKGFSISKILEVQCL